MQIINPRFSPLTIFSITLLLIGAVWIWASAAPPGSTAGRIPAPRPGFQAPDFSLQTIEGDTIRLSDLRGRPVLINLWASWCPPCRAEMPTMQRVYSDLESEGFVVLAINATNQDHLPAVQEFIEEYQLTFPVLLDPSGKVSAAYELRSLPTSFFVDGEGLIREMVIGGPMAEALLRIRAEQLFEAPR